MNGCPGGSQAWEREYVRASRPDHRFPWSSPVCDPKENRYKRSAIGATTAMHAIASRSAPAESGSNAMTSHTRRLPKEIMLGLLPAAFEPWGSLESRPPTDESIRRIESTLRIKLPALFVEVANACSSYGGWFNSIGDDYENHQHILSLNAAFHAEGLATRYVLMTHGHDDDCDAWDLEGAPSNDEYPIVCFDYDCDRNHLSGLKLLAASFADYIDSFVRWKAPRCPVKRLRRRAKRILGEYGN